MTTMPAVGTLTELFSRSVERYPDRPAVSDDTRTLTYAQLDRESDAVSALLRSHGVGTEDRVGLYVSRSVDLFVAVLGILKSGAAYVAVDTRYPDTRRDLMLSRSGAKAILTEAGWEDRLSALSATVIPLADRAGFDGTPSEGIVEPSSAASVLFTSGSSGEPKAIVLEHRNLVSFARNPSLPTLEPEDRTGQISSVSFDAFHFEIWSTFAHGAQSVVLPPVPDLLAADFQRQMKKYGITAMLVPTMVVNHVVREDRDAFSSLRILQAGGDVILPSACRALLTGQFKGSLYNLYGPAEITTACTAHRVTLEDAESDVIPIGRPLDGVSVRILSPELQPVPVGEIGELFVSGPGVARGYQDRADLTDERFLTLPAENGDARLYRTGDLVREREDGVLVFVGRADNQVKIRGYRVEPGEVERGLRRYPEVQEAVVLPDGEGNDRRLVAFVVIEDALSVKELRERAEKDLPDFMVPSQFIVQSQIPATAHGKRDLDALRALLAKHLEREEAYAAPQTDTERFLVSLWENLLSTERVGRDEDFFGLGGHSLLAFRMHHRINRELGVSLKFPVLLDNTVLKDLAAAIDASREGTETA
ncbi:amino acid adenylation domain-containing protein [Kitasatospora atroaurantiaca]|uniref:Amino acid adenylation domain-containing protein n=2 Tax=Kitasatospora atroaurantiaca TaxID=285545 RepID=A0A561ERI3_9ACTN|nr:amino acid adenylation domain-containing protein [Kitasatospora atroaurantiaca]